MERIVSFDSLGLERVAEIGEKWGHFFSSFDGALAQEYNFADTAYLAKFASSDHYFDLLNLGINYCLESGMKVPDDLIQDARSFLEENPDDDSVAQELLRATLDKV